MFLNQRLEAGDSVRKVQIMRTVLSAATRGPLRRRRPPEVDRDVACVTM